MMQKGIGGVTRRQVGFLAMAAVAATATSAGAETWPTKAVRLVVAWPPGGGGDIVGRVVATKLSELLGQPVVVDNRPGASGTIGTDYASKAAADGYTLLLGQANNNVIAPNVLKVGYDPANDFTPISYIGFVPNVLVVSKHIPVGSVAELIALAKAKSGELTYASAGIGSIQHLTGGQFARVTGTKIIHVPYQGSGAALADLLAGRVTMNFDTMPSVLRSIRSGDLRALAVSTSSRVPQLPDVPTFGEVGITELRMRNWYSVVAPKGLPAPIVAKVDAAMQQVLKDPEVRQRLDSQGMIYEGPRTPAEFGAYLREEVQRYAELVKALGIKSSD